MGLKTKIILLLLVVCPLVWCKSAKKRGPRKSKVEKTQKLKTEKVEPPEPKEAVNPVSVGLDVEAKTGPRYRLNSLLGLHVLKSSSLYSGLQFGWTPKPGGGFYFGPEFGLSAFASGSLILLAGGAWYDLFAADSKTLGVTVGLVTGLGFAERTPLPERNLVALFDLALVHYLDELSSIRAQMRPGYIGSEVSFLMAFNFSFLLA